MARVAAEKQKATSKPGWAELLRGAAAEVAAQKEAEGSRKSLPPLARQLRGVGHLPDLEAGAGRDSADAAGPEAPSSSGAPSSQHRKSASAPGARAPIRAPSGLGPGKDLEAAEAAGVAAGGAATRRSLVRWGSEGKLASPTASPAERRSLVRSVSQVCLSPCISPCSSPCTPHASALYPTPCISHPCCSRLAGQAGRRGAERGDGGAARLGSGVGTHAGGGAAAGFRKPVVLCGPRCEPDLASAPVGGQEGGGVEEVGAHPDLRREKERGYRMDICRVGWVGELACGVGYPAVECVIYPVCIQERDPYHRM